MYTRGPVNQAPYWDAELGQGGSRTLLAGPRTTGNELHGASATYTVTDRTLTETCNLPKDANWQGPAVQHLRRLHETMDRSVTGAYGWTDLEVPPSWPTRASKQKPLETFQDQVLGRLFVSNAYRSKGER